MTVEFEPNLGRVLVEVDSDAERTAGGIIIAHSAERSTVRNATVRAHGVARMVDGNFTYLPLTDGDRVVIDTLGATKIKINGKEMLLLRGEDIIGKIP